VAPEAPVWSDQQLLIALAQFLRTTTTGFPPGMPPLAPSLLTSPNLLFPSTAPPAPGPQDKLVVYTFLYLPLAALRRLSVALGEMVIIISFVDCYFDFQFCFGHIVKDACHFLYRRNNEHMI